MTRRCRLFGRRATAVVPNNRVAAEASLSPFNRTSHLAGMNPIRDKHLRSADFFDIATHPDLTFTADGVSPAGEGVRVTGRLTVRGRTRPASFDAKVSTAEGEVWLDGELRVNRADFGLTWNRMGIASMDNTIVVHAVFTRQ